MPKALEIISHKNTLDSVDIILRGLWHSLQLKFNQSILVLIITYQFRLFHWNTAKKDDNRNVFTKNIVDH